jgi:hypothetical protein
MKPRCFLWAINLILNNLLVEMSFTGLSNDYTQRSTAIYRTMVPSLFSAQEDKIMLMQTDEHDTKTRAH